VKCKAQPIFLFELIPPFDFDSMARIRSKERQSRQGLRPSVGERLRSTSSNLRSRLKHRKRSLTPPPSSRPATRSLKNQQIPYQAQCGLLTKLSAEIRLMIWESVIGGLKLHIVKLFRGDTLRSWVCEDNCLWCLVGEPYIDSATVLYTRPPNYSLLSLLRTCRQV
jgi:hypothetical protein